MAAPSPVTQYFTLGKSKIIENKRSIRALQKKIKAEQGKLQKKIKAEEAKTKVRVDRLLREDYGHRQVIKAILTKEYIAGAFASYIARRPKEQSRAELITITRTHGHMAGTRTQIHLPPYYLRALSFPEDGKDRVSIAIIEIDSFFKIHQAELFPGWEVKVEVTRKPREEWTGVGSDKVPIEPDRITSVYVERKKRTG